MKTEINKVAILDCIGLNLTDKSRPMQVRFAKCLVHEDGTIERQYHDDKLMCHRVTIQLGENIEQRMVMESIQIARMGYDPPTRDMIERIKAHCAIEWAPRHEPLTIEHQEFVPMDLAQMMRETIQ